MLHVRYLHHRRRTPYGATLSTGTCTTQGRFYNWANLTSLTCTCAGTVPPDGPTVNGSTEANCFLLSQYVSYFFDLAPGVGLQPAPSGRMLHFFPWCVRGLAPDYSSLGGGRNWSGLRACTRFQGPAKGCYLFVLLQVCSHPVVAPSHALPVERRRLERPMEG